jgi:RIP metalloprotease RseP
VNGAATTITVTVPGATTAPATAPATAPTTATALEDVTDPPAPAEALAPTPAPVDVATLRFAVVEEDLADQGLQARVSSTRDVVIAAVRRQQAMRGIAGYEGLVVAVEEESPAGARAVKPREHRIVAVDGAPLRVASDLSLALQKDVDAIHVVGVVDGAGRGATFAFRMQKSTRRELGGARILGVGLASAHGDAAMIERHVGVGEAFRRAVDESLQSARVVLSGYWMLFTGRVGLDQIGGPVLIANIAGEAARAGLEVFVATMCLVSMNLAFLNLLPVPVLDGGHLLLFTIEAVRGRKLSSEARLKATRIGLLFVGALMLVALLNDFLSLVS